MSRSATTRSDIRMQPQLSILNANTTLDTLQKTLGYPTTFVLLDFKKVQITELFG